MRLLLGCVNTSVSLMGYDWETGEVFWAVPRETLRVCGVCYHGSDLLISGDSFLTRLQPTGGFRTPLGGRYDALAHSVHVLDDGHAGVVDTGNSRLICVDLGGQIVDLFEPIDTWGDIPQDAIHLNDFVVAPTGTLATCFDYRPWREVKAGTSWDDWCTGGYGIILNLTGDGSNGAGRVVGCGFNHPHSLNYVDDRLYLCSSATGVFHVCELDPDGTVRETGRFQVTNDHFLRGAYNTDGGWYLGGSSTRHGEVMADTIEIYRLETDTGRVEKRSIPGNGEIYDILPWRDDVMQPIIRKHFSG